MGLGFAEAAVDWAVATDGELAFTYTMTIVVLNPDLVRAPTSVTVSLSEGAPTTPVVFQIDGTTVATEDTDLDGYITALSLEVPETLGIGTHTITATQGGNAGSATFTLAQPPITTDTAMGPDAAPIAIAGAAQPQGFYRWVLQDLMPGGLGSWVMPKNPKEWKSPVFERSLTAQHATAQAGQFHIIEGDTPVVEFSFSGLVTTKEEHDKLLAYGKLNRRFYLIDHWNRAWKVTFIDVAMSAHLRTNYNGAVTDWLHDYTVTAYAYEPSAQVPA